MKRSSRALTSRVLALGLALALTGCARAPETSARPPMAGAGPGASPAVREITEFEDFALLERGTYSIDPDGDASTRLRVVFEVPFAWYKWIGASKSAGDGHAGVGITTVRNLVSHGCRDHRPADPPVGPAVDDLATALTHLAPFEVVSPPKDVSIYGYRGKHLQWRVPDMPVERSGDDLDFTPCIEGNLKSWISPTWGPYHGYTGPGYTEEFWILDVEDTRLMIVAKRSAGSPPQDLAELRAVLASIRIEP
ncbi:MAG TPA: hypothetical protein VM638_02150 [Actinomycetota bacterium]|nr:hypothetical protein [Actinomycetota bacterium]